MKAIKNMADKLKNKIANSDFKVQLAITLVINFTHAIMILETLSPEQELCGYDKILNIANMAILPACMTAALIYCISMHKIKLFQYFKTAIVTTAILLTISFANAVITKTSAAVDLAAIIITGSILDIALMYLCMAATMHHK